MSNPENPQHNAPENSDAKQKQAEILANCGGELPFVDQIDWRPASYAREYSIQNSRAIVPATMIGVFSTLGKPREVAVFVRHGFLQDGEAIPPTTQETHQSILSFTYDEWDAFIAGAKESEFDLQSRQPGDVEDSPIVQSGDKFLPSTVASVTIDADTGQLVFVDESLERHKVQAAENRLGKTALEQLDTPEQD